MRVVVQRVTRAQVSVAGQIVGRIAKGLLLLVGIAVEDSAADVEFLLNKIVNLRIFDDADGRMNDSLLDVAGELLIVSQFTLYGDTSRGRRPSYIQAASPDKAQQLYHHFVDRARTLVPKVETGQFQAMMQVELVNDGPVTILVDTDKTI